ncbi:type II toxin-antitoxin system RelE/ParE family toxin [Polaribacter vadi]|uniref:type II toxin-antitoxin system RelE family toxin n=1 Tax=Polaribacter TaxID=52959 RepID=UPI001C091B68|nr:MULTISPECIES: type II toxin-antitoxin system RelE/ParE family toxin [Polaribacter]MBU3011270.1 type II toxin-antitoxin system RelE/ParE family toxin [Polaribacter vadi]MDO6741083.1 type II toxin-antitoxin system RelE/ParE family toxin [Polaribacter sp. 1_MG-2023]
MEVIYLKSLEKDLKKIKDKKLLKSLKNIFVNLEEAKYIFDISNVKKLSGHPDAYRVRVGDYRLGIFYTDETITIARFLKRNDIYKLFP